VGYVFGDGRVVGGAYLGLVCDVCSGNQGSLIHPAGST
jgi:hypothetical protein